MEFRGRVDVHRVVILLARMEGEMRLIALTARLDGRPVAEFSWEGDDEGEQRSDGRWVAWGTAGRLVGHVYIHGGDDSGFLCEPW